LAVKSTDMRNPADNVMYCAHVHIYIMCVCMINRMYVTNVYAYIYIYNIYIVHVCTHVYSWIAHVRNFHCQEFPKQSKIVTYL
jgi:hypothetical protein